MLGHFGLKDGVRRTGPCIDGFWFPIWIGVVINLCLLKGLDRLVLVN